MGMAVHVTCTEAAWLLPLALVATSVYVLGPSAVTVSEQDAFVERQPDHV